MIDLLAIDSRRLTFVCRCAAPPISPCLSLKFNSVQQLCRTRSSSQAKSRASAWLFYSDHRPFQSFPIQTRESVVPSKRQSINNGDCTARSSPVFSRQQYRQKRTAAVSIYKRVGRTLGPTGSFVFCVATETDEWRMKEHLLPPAPDSVDDVPSRAENKAPLIRSVLHPPFLFSLHSSRRPFDEVFSRLISSTCWEVRTSNCVISKWQGRQTNGSLLYSILKDLFSMRTCH